MPRKKHKYHFIYKTTCLLNENYYVGMHSTSNLDDGYLGSGKKLKRSIKKYGEENFKREILEFVESRDLLKKREAELVDDDLLKDPKCMNLQHGGGGGISSAQHEKNLHNGASLFLQEKWKDNDYRKNMKTISSETMTRSRIEGKIHNFPSFKGKTHSMNTIALMKKTHLTNKHQVGLSNSQYNSHWITNDKENKKIHSEDIIPNGWRYGRKMNKNV